MINRNEIWVMFLRDDILKWRRSLFSTVDRWKALRDLIEQPVIAAETVFIECAVLQNLDFCSRFNKNRPLFRRAASFQAIKYRGRFL